MKANTKNEYKVGFFILLIYSIITTLIMIYNNI